MNALEEDVRNLGHEECELRVESRGTAPIIRGYAIVFDRLSQNLGGFRERIRPSAIDRTLREVKDLRAFVEHDPGRVLGRQSNGKLRVERDVRGLRVEIEPPMDTPHGQTIVALIRRGDVDGMSFAFRMMPDGERWDETDSETQLPIRDVTDMLVREVSVVSMPAYLSTEVAVRSFAAVRIQMAGRHPRGRTVAEHLAWSQRLTGLDRRR